MLRQVYRQWDPPSNEAKVVLLREPGICIARALKEVKVGQQIVADYGTGYWTDDDDPHPNGGKIMTTAEETALLGRPSVDRVQAWSRRKRDRSRYVIDYMTCIVACRTV